MIGSLTTSSIKEDTIKHLKTILSNSDYSSEICHVVLSNIKQNEFEITNTLSIGGLLAEIGNEAECFSHLASKCQDKLSSGHFEYVSQQLGHFKDLSEVLFVKLTDGAPADLAIINLTNGLFLPHFSNSDYTPEQISQLCEVFHHFVKKSSAPCSNLVRTLVQSTHHKVAAFAAFLRIQTAHQNMPILSSDLMIEMFDSLDPTDCDNFGQLLHNLALVAENVPELQKHLLNFISVSVPNVQIHDKLVKLLNVIRWNEGSTSHVQAIELILNKEYTRESLKIFTPVLHNIASQCPIFSDKILVKITDILSSYPEEVTQSLLHVFRPRPDVVISYFADKLPVLNVDMALLMDLFQRYGVLNMVEFCEGVTWSESDEIVFNTCLEFISCSDLSANVNDQFVENLVKLIVCELTHNGLNDLSSKILGCIKTQKDLCHKIVNELISKNNMFVIHVAKELIQHGTEIDWNQIESLESLSFESIISLARAFKDQALKDMINTRKDGELSVLERLCYITFSTPLSKITNYEEIFEFLTTHCFDSSNTDHQMTARIFSLFLPILFHTTSANEEDIQFVLNSTAATLQTTLDILSETPCTRENYFLTACLVSFTQLYKILHDSLKVQKLEKFQDVLEDWDAFYEPGIQDLALALHDKLLSISLPTTAAYLSPVVLLAPPASIRSFMKTVLNKTEDITFDECFKYFMKCYTSLPYETQTSLFYLLLHCQQLFPTKPETSITTDEESAEFASPPTIFIDALSEIDLVNFESELEYENRLIQATHFWTLLLISESKQSPGVLREHVEFLRSKQILSEFLDNLVYLIKFSAKKYEIIPMDKITDCASFASHQLASSCFMGIATVFPALLRRWWMKLGKELKISVEKYVTSFISPTLIKLETKVQKNPEDETLVVSLSLTFCNPQNRTYFSLSVNNL